jgi:hypothetical protein
MRLVTTVKLSASIAVALMYVTSVCHKVFKVFKDVFGVLVSLFFACVSVRVDTTNVPKISARSFLENVYFEDQERDGITLR